MIIPKNEGKACDAVVRHIELCTGDKRTDIRFPEKDGHGPPVDMRVQVAGRDYAIEHTLLQPRESQIKYSAVFRDIKRFIQERICGPLPGAVYYELHLPTQVSLPKGKKNRDRALNNLAEWILSTAQRLHERRGEYPPSFFVDNTVKEVPDGFQDEFDLLRWPDGVSVRRTPGSLGLRFSALDDSEDLLRKTLSTAFDRKFPKLHQCREQGARTVLVLEAIALPIGHCQIIGNHLPALLEQRSDPPDEIYLVEPRTYETMWWIWPVKRDGEHWPALGMPENGRPYFPLGQIPTERYSQWHRDLNGPFEIWPQIPLEWSLAEFEEEELNDLTQSRAASAS